MSDPRVVGGRYYDGYWHYEYILVARTEYTFTCRIVDNSRVASNLRDLPQFQIGYTWLHWTDWDDHRDVVVSQPNLICDSCKMYVLRLDGTCPYVLCKRFKKEAV